MIDSNFFVCYWCWRVREDRDDRCQPSSHPRYVCNHHLIKQNLIKQNFYDNDYKKISQDIYVIELESRIFHAD